MLSKRNLERKNICRVKEWTYFKEEDFIYLFIFCHLFFVEQPSVGI